MNGEMFVAGFFFILAFLVTKCNKNCYNDLKVVMRAVSHKKCIKNCEVTKIKSVKKICNENCSVTKRMLLEARGVLTCFFDFRSRHNNYVGSNRDRFPNSQGLEHES